MTLDFTLQYALITDMSDYVKEIIAHDRREDSAFLRVINVLDCWSEFVELFALST